MSNESVVPRSRFDSVEQYLVFLRHLAEHDFAKEYVKDKVVLEVGCGTGNGANYTSNYAREVVAVDIANDAIDILKDNILKRIYALGSSAVNCLLMT